MTESAPDSPSRRRWGVMRLKRFLPRSLYARTLLIIVVPMLLTLAAATFVFFDRHWYTVTNRLTRALAGDVALAVGLQQGAATESEAATVAKLTTRTTDLQIRFKPDLPLPRVPQNDFDPVRDLLISALRQKLAAPFTVRMLPAEDAIEVTVAAPDGIYILRAPERRLSTPTTEVFIAWMVGSSILLSAIALLFMRNQIRPVRRLADAAEALGKGRDVPWFKIEGAAEVRQAAAALMVMRDRLTRQVTQRTTMLAGVSHDLRTPLTRMRLQIELMPDSEETRALSGDIDDMDVMLNAYLAFARGEESETESDVDIGELVDEVAQAARRQNPNLTVDVPDRIVVTLRRNAMKRCLGNLVGNALRYGRQAAVTVTRGAHHIDIIVDDNGPGIAADRREDMFRPFTRMEDSRNQATGGVGLGLTIARDIARAHGGDVLLDASPLGGLQARIRVPV